MNEVQERKSRLLPWFKVKVKMFSARGSGMLFSVVHVTGHSPVKGPRGGRVPLRRPLNGKERLRFAGPRRWENRTRLGRWPGCAGARPPQPPAPPLAESAGVQPYPCFCPRPDSGIIFHCSSSLFGVILPSSPSLCHPSSNYTPHPKALIRRNPYIGTSLLGLDLRIQSHCPGTFLSVQMAAEPQ